MENRTTELLTLNDLRNILHLSRSTIYRKLDPNGKHYDLDFPKPIKISEKGNRWILLDINNWIAKKNNHKEEN